MRRLPVFLLLVVVFGSLVAGCGGDGSADPTQVVESWSQAITGSDDEKAAGFFGPDAVVIQDGQRTTLAGEADALAFNSSLPCGYKVVDQKVEGNETTATFTLTRRPGHMCDGTGEAETVVFQVTDGKITLWHQLPPGSSDQQAS